jgi:hypothetical protein
MDGVPLVFVNPGAVLDKLYFTQLIVMQQQLALQMLRLTAPKK